jgi:hypothetical protein
MSSTLRSGAATSGGKEEAAGLDASSGRHGRTAIYSPSAVGADGWRGGRRGERGGTEATEFELKPLSPPDLPSPVAFCFDSLMIFVA